MASSQRDTAPEPERLIEAWRTAAAEAQRWRDEPRSVAALKAARNRLHQPEAPPPRRPEQVLADELRTARAALECADGESRALAYANLKRWEPGLFGYSETQRSTAGKIAASEAEQARRDAQERAEALALVREFREVQDRARAAARAVWANPQARALADREGLPRVSAS